jgi:hypothetical protein
MGGGGARRCGCSPGVGTESHPYEVEGGHESHPYEEDLRWLMLH